MANELTIERLKFAREIGATVFNESSGRFKKYDEDGNKYFYAYGCWELVNINCGQVRGDIEIDFSPLDDKELMLSGVRAAGKSKYQDIKKARDTLNRWLEINKDLAE